MAICMTCGTVMHDDDVANHTCDAANIPEKGVERKPVTEAVVREIIAG